MLRKRGKGFFNYGIDTLRNSMVTGIPQIIRATNTPNKILRTIVLIVSFTGFVYQSLNFMDLYWQYKTITDVAVQTTKETELPSVTVCNSNGIYRSQICNDYRFLSECSVLEDNPKYEIFWCDCLKGRWCSKGTLGYTLVAYGPLYHKIALMNYTDYEMLLQKLEDFFGNCHYTDDTLKAYWPCDMEYYLQVRCPGSSYEIEGCFTLNTIIGRPEMKPEKIPSKGVYFLLLTPHAEEYPPFPKKEVVSVHLSIHTPRQIVNPFSKGISMIVNTVQELRLKKVVQKLLPPPYDTNCQDYIEMWKQRGGHGPVNQHECFEECLKNVSMQDRGCIPRFYQMPGNERRCSYKEQLIDLLEDENTKCEKEHCQPACFEETYEVTRQIKEQYSEAGCGFGSDPYQNINVAIFLNGMVTVTYSYSPKFEVIETFSYIGGYVGIWLGISLIAVFDFLETVILIMSYPLKNYMKARKRNGRTKRIKNLARDL